MSQQPSSASRLSPLQLFARLPEPERESFLAGLTDDEKAALAYEWDRWLARPDQLPPDSDWRFWLVMAGRGFGKTRIGAEEIRKASKRLAFPNLIGATADDARDIMIEGESGILAVCPSWERPTYMPSKRQLSWPSGAKSLIFTADEPERLRGKQHMWLWCDEVAAWRYPESWDQAMLGLRLGENPQAVVTTTPKPTPLIRELIDNPYTVVTRGSTYDNISNLAPAFAAEIIRKYEGTRLGRQELQGELLLDEGLAYRFSESVHVIPAFDPPAAWQRFESMDYGSSPTSATAWLAYAVDYDGNVIVFDELYQPGFPSELVPLVKERRKRWHPNGDQNPTCWADPAIWNNSQTTNKWGAPAVVNDEFQALGFSLSKANNDRRAGYTRISELLRLEDDKRPSTWAVHLRDSLASPSLFVMDCCPNVIRQLREAPLGESDPGPLHDRFPGEAVAEGWESRNGHAHASLRYGLLSWPRASVEPPPEPETPQQALLLRHKERRENPSRRYERV